jgi:hypothetical protein
MRHVWLGSACMLAACSGQEQNFTRLTPEIAVTPPGVDVWVLQQNSLGPVPGGAPGDIIVGEVGTQELFISNQGRADLTVTLALDSDVFSIDHVDVAVEPDALSTYLLTFTPDAIADFSATLVVSSNDEDTPTIEVPLTGRGVDEPTPDIDVDTLSIDFGDVPFGDDDNVVTFMHNVGTAPLTVGTMIIEGSPAFTLPVPFPSGTKLDVNGDHPLVVVYEPLFPGIGDNGTLVIPSDDPDEPEVRIALIGNGGGDFEYPQAVVDCPGIVEVLGPEVVVLDGSDSNDPAGQTPLTYSWRTARVPEGSATSIDVQGSSSPLLQVPVDVAGIYEVLLTVENALNIPSPATSCVIDVVPIDKLRVELSWDGPKADLDLHLLQGDTASMWQIPFDACFCNDTPNWGALDQVDDDPRIELDDRGGFGPENINILEPIGGIYAVRVHYFDTNGDSAVTATVVVWANGEKVWEGSEPMVFNQVWDVGQLNWPDGSFAANDNPVYLSPTRVCAE